jgi:acetyl-CoA hydrolase
MNATVDALKQLLKPGDTVLVSAGTGEPLALIEALIEAAAELGGPPLRAIQVTSHGTERLADASGPTLTLWTPVPNTKSRKAIAEGRAVLYPESMASLARAIEDGTLAIGGVLAQGRELDARTATPGLIADIMFVAWEHARFRALELNDRLPRIRSERLLDIERAQIVVRSSREPTEVHEENVSDAAARIGAFVAEIVPDGATLELGIGRALAGIVPALNARRRDLAMHTGIVGDAAMHLINGGAVSRPIRGPALAVGPTAMGTHRFYAWADDNERIALVDSRIAHNADALAATPRFTAVNSALQVDLAGNVNLTSRGGRIVSSVGGAGNFTAAGARSEASIIALMAASSQGVSSIVPAVEAVSIPSAHVTHVVTEHGVAFVRNLDRAARARALAMIAAPEHRPALLAVAAG